MPELWQGERKMKKRVKMSEGIEEKSHSKNQSTTTSSFTPASLIRLLSHLVPPTPTLPSPQEEQENKGIIEAQARLHMPQMPI